MMHTPVTGAVERPPAVPRPTRCVILSSLQGNETEMADVIVAPGSAGGEAPATRRQFEAPVVEDLGRLQDLTMLQGLSF
jgi:hypothetical protein